MSKQAPPMWECYWITPEGAEHSRDEANSHDDILVDMAARGEFDYNEYGNHGLAFELGFLRICVLHGSEFSAQWGSTLSSTQQAACKRIAAGCDSVELSAAEQRWDPEGSKRNFSLQIADSRFKRLFAAALRRSMGDW